MDFPIENIEFIGFLILIKKNHKNAKFGESTRLGKLIFGQKGENISL